MTPQWCCAHLNDLQSPRCDKGDIVLKKSKSDHRHRTTMTGPERAPQPCLLLILLRQTTESPCNSALSGGAVLFFHVLRHYDVSQLQARTGATAGGAADTRMLWAAVCSCAQKGSLCNDSGRGLALGVRCGVLWSPTHSAGRCWTRRSFAACRVTDDGHMYAVCWFWSGGC